MKNVFWLLFAEDQLFDQFIDMCNNWVVGNLPDGMGILGVRKHERLITPGLFRCFEGDISSSNITSLINDVKEGRALLKKDPGNKADTPALSDMAFTIKITRKL